jgi:riboflavin kinase/FMN adenylyltransferase
MRIIHGFPPARGRLAGPLAATIGVFDGVHLGHLAILRATLARARKIRGTGLVITFDRHPLKTLAPHVVPHCLMTLEQRLAEFERLKFRHCVVLPFTAALANLTASAFVHRVLARRLGISELVVGYDFHFGRCGTGDAALLKRLGENAGFGVTVVAPALHRGEPISSTRIRRLVSLGNVAEAARLLGRPPALAGTRVKGRRLGRRLGFPTINIQPANELLPPYGVYAVKLGRKAHAGVANLGVRPAVTPPGCPPLIEVHCLSTPPRIPPGRPVEVALLRFMRPERDFPGLAALKNQISRDVAGARRFFART